MLRSALLNVMVAAALKAGRSLKRDFGEVEHLQVSLKGPADFVSAADRKAEQILKTELLKARPGTDATHTWIVDPLDGTTNFLHGIPQFAVSIGLERNGIPVAGVIYNPANDELYTAERGTGAFLNDRRLRVSARTKPEESVVGCGVPHIARGDHVQFRNELKIVQSRFGGIRRMGACALDLAYVAAGRFDGFWERGVSAWDMAAGIVLIREAGGFVTDCDGHDNMLLNGTICAGNEPIQKALLAAVKEGQRG
ncbi:MAG: myo-inositol-1(or 4)-monophosphatase [Xanthobacteraceae bacterium]|nr:MAG: myo-inositol-1(or 4)-monophosphatase [Xanthobacteraceae bacterium]